MKKKLKITEAQLQKIMEQQTTMDETNLGMIEKELVQKYVKMIIADIKEDMLMGKVNLQWIGRGIEHELSYFDPEEMSSDEEMGDMDMPIPPSEEETDANQIYESIKKDFKRFL